MSSGFAAQLDKARREVDREAHAARHVIEAEAREPARARALATPGAPTETERTAHVETHLPFRSWCEDCVEGKAKDAQHKAVPKGETLSQLARWTTASQGLRSKTQGWREQPKRIG